FGLSNHIVLAGIGRLLIGLGSAFAFVGMVFICSHLFPQHKRALVIGLANSIGMLGAVAGGGPLSVMIHYFNWRTVIEFLGFFGVLLAFGIFLFYFHDDEQDVKQDSQSRSLWNLIKNVCKNPYSWLNSIVASLFYLSTSTFGGLWGTSFLQASYGWSKQSASFAMSMVFVGWLIGGPLTGLISDLLKKRKPIISTAIFFTLLCLFSVIYIPHLPPVLVYTLLLLVGLFSSAELLHFSYAIEINTPKTKGTAVAFTNGVISLLESGVQPIIGWFLVLGWAGKIEGGIPVYSVHDYKIALGVLPIGLVLALILSFFLKEKKYKEEATPHSSYVENA
ncbi:MAG: MFS transporter, partial [Chlamydiales bacterium]|nr:MFS transporter [Chlamydiales bacterium]